MLLPEVGYRLSGFIDGEGHFAIYHQRNSQPSGRESISYGCRFYLGQRDDDTAILERFQKETGLGRIFRIAPRVGAVVVSRPTSAWQIQGQRECLRLVEILETYPLWTTKADDFAVWAKAVRYLVGPRPHGWAPMEHWFHEIRAVRQYQPMEVFEQAVIEMDPLFDPDSLQ